MSGHGGVRQEAGVTVLYAVTPAPAVCPRCTDLCKEMSHLFPGPVHRDDTRPVHLPLWRSARVQNITSSWCEAMLPHRHNKTKQSQTWGARLWGLCYDHSHSPLVFLLKNVPQVRIDCCLSGVWMDCLRSLDKGWKLLVGNGRSGTQDTRITLVGGSIEKVDKEQHTEIIDVNRLKGRVFTGWCDEIITKFTESLHRTGKLEPQNINKSKCFGEVISWMQRKAAVAADGMPWSATAFDVFMQ